MSGQINKAMYDDMIQSLQSFANNLVNYCDEMTALCSTCAQVLGEGDVAVAGINKQINVGIKIYYQAAKDAISISKDLQEELKNAIGEGGVWSDMDSNDSE